MTGGGNPTNDIRRRMLAARDKLSSEERASASKQLCDVLLRMLCADFRAPSVAYLAYMPIRSEADIRPLCKELSLRGEAFYYPVVHGDRLNFYRAEAGSDFVRGAFGCQEPADRTAPLGDREFAVALVPGVAFSPRGDRIGYGKGYYDRFLAAYRGSLKKVGICFEAQLCDDIVPAPTDVPMDIIVTEKRCLYPGAT